MPPIPREVEVCLAQRVGLEERVFCVAQGVVSFVWTPVSLMQGRHTCLKTLISDESIRLWFYMSSLATFLLSEGTASFDVEFARVREIRCVAPHACGYVHMLHDE